MSKKKRVYNKLLPSHVTELFSMVEHYVTHGWCKGALARDHRGRECAINYEVEDDNIASYSLPGAMHRACYVLSEEEDIDGLELFLILRNRFQTALSKLNEKSTISQWNDRKDVTHDEVMMLVERAFNV